MEVATTIKYDATLTDVHPNGIQVYSSVYGHIANDSKNRFKDGTPVRTSIVKEYWKLNEKQSVIRTATGTTYLVIH